MPLPERALLLDGAAALDVRLDDAQVSQLLAYVELLVKWNRVINLTAIRDATDMLSRHVLDSLAIVAPLRRHGHVRRLLDVGSGAGLPGVVVAIAMPEVVVTCVDAVAKKAAFVEQVALELKLPALSGRHSRVEQMAGVFDVVASRAFSSLADFVALTRQRLCPGGVWLAMKGHAPHSEIAALPSWARVFHVEHLHVPGLKAERCLVWMKDFAERDSTA